MQHKDRYLYKETGSRGSNDREPKRFIFAELNFVFPLFVFFR